MLRAEFGIAHALGIFLKGVGLNADLLSQLRIGRNDGTKRGHQVFNLPLIQQIVLMGSHPAFLLSLLVGEQLAGQFPEVLAGVIKIDDLNRAGEVLIGNIPDPFRSIAYDDLLFGAAPTALSGQPPILAYYIRSDIGLVSFFVPNIPTSVTRLGYGEKKKNPAIPPLSSRTPARDRWVAKRQTEV